MGCVSHLLLILDIVFCISSPDPLDLNLPPHEECVKRFEIAEAYLEHTATLASLLPAYARDYEQAKRCYDFWHDACQLQSKVGYNEPEHRLPIFRRLQKTMPHYRFLTEDWPMPGGPQVDGPAAPAGPIQRFKEVL